MQCSVSDFCQLQSYSRCARAKIVHIWGYFVPDVIGHYCIGGKTAQGGNGINLECQKCPKGIHLDVVAAYG